MPATATQSTTDIDALRAQVDRLNAELDRTKNLGAKRIVAHRLAEKRRDLRRLLQVGQRPVRVLVPGGKRRAPVVSRPGLGGPAFGPPLPIADAVRQPPALEPDTRGLGFDPVEGLTQTPPTPVPDALQAGLQPFTEPPSPGGSVLPSVSPTTANGAASPPQAGSGGTAGAGLPSFVPVAPALAPGQVPGPEASGFPALSPQDARFKKLEAILADIKGTGQPSIAERWLEHSRRTGEPIPLRILPTLIQGAIQERGQRFQNFDRLVDLVKLRNEFAQEDRAAGIRERTTAVSELNVDLREQEFGQKTSGIARQELEDETVNIMAGRSESHPGPPITADDALRFNRNSTGDPAKLPSLRELARRLGGDMGNMSVLNDLARKSQGIPGFIPSRRRMETAEESLRERARQILTTSPSSPEQQQMAKLFVAQADKIKEGLTRIKQLTTGEELEEIGQALRKFPELRGEFSPEPGSALTAPRR